MALITERYLASDWQFLIDFGPLKLNFYFCFLTFKILAISLLFAALVCDALFMHVSSYIFRGPTIKDKHDIMVI